MQRHGLGWVGAGGGAVRASSRAGACPPGLLHNFLGYFKLSGRSSHGSAAGAVNGRDSRPFCMQVKLQKVEKQGFFFWYKLLSSSLSPHLGSETLEFGESRGGGEAGNQREP